MKKIELGIEGGVISLAVDGQPIMTFAPGPNCDQPFGPSSPVPQWVVDIFGRGHRDANVGNANPFIVGTMASNLWEWGAHIAREQKAKLDLEAKIDARWLEDRKDETQGKPCSCAHGSCSLPLGWLKPGYRCMWRGRVGDINAPLVSGGGGKKP